MHSGIVGECALGTDASDAVSCVSPPSSSSFAGGRPCGNNEWYVGTRTPMFAGSIAVSDSAASSPADTSTPFRSDFSWQTMNKVVYLSAVGSTAETRQTRISLYSRASQLEAGEHSLLAVMNPRENYFERLDYYGSSKNTSIYPVASTTDWNAVDVMLSYDERSIYIFFSYTFDFIGKCAVPQDGAPQYASIPSSACSYLSRKDFTPTALDTGVTGTSFTYRGCVRMVPMHYLACLYDLQGARSIMYAVDELREGAQKLVVDTYDDAYLSTGERVGRPKSPPAWDPVTKRLYYIIDLNNGNNMGIRFVQLNATYHQPSSAWTVYKGFVSDGILWRGVGSDSSNYHSLVLMRSQSSAASSLVAACSPPSCPPQLSMVSFTGTFSSSGDRSTMPLPSSTHVRSLRVRWGIKSAGADATDGSSYVGQQLYVLSREDRLWGLWTHCASCPANSFSPAGSSLSTPGINSCKCSSNYYGVIRRPVVDECSRCRLQFILPDLNTISPASTYTSCDPGQYKTNVPCSSASPDRSIDTTCAQCYQSCRPGDASTKFPGEYISSQCDGSGYEPRVGCTTCTDQCLQDDQYMRVEVVCSGEDSFDTRPQQACAPCTTKCPQNAYVSSRCLRANRPTNNTALCVSCSSCSNGEYVAQACNGSTFYDARKCSGCR